MMLRRNVIIFLILMALLTNGSEGKRKSKLKNKKQFTPNLESRETDPPNFIRLLLMRLIYGIAVQVGAEDRLAGFLNGAFVPPNAEEDTDYGFGGLDGLFGEIGGGGDDVLDF